MNRHSLSSLFGLVGVDSGSRTSLRVVVAVAQALAITLSFLSSRMYSNQIVELVYFSEDIFLDACAMWGF